MGRHSSDSDSGHRYSRKHKKRRSRSPSYSSDDTRSRSRSKSVKKSKKSKHRRRSRSRSSSYRRRTSRSPSPYSRRRRSRSRSPSRRSRRSRSHSRGSSRASSVTSKGGKKHDPCSDIPGFDSMPPSKQAELRLQLALKAAAAADQKLQDRGLLGESSRSTPVSFEDQQRRMQDIDSIEHESFEQAAFQSSKTTGSAKSMDTLHSDAIFSSSSGPIIFPPPTPVGTSVLSDVRQLFGALFYIPQEEKQRRWMKKLKAMRQKKLEGTNLV